VIFDMRKYSKILAVFAIFCVSYAAQAYDFVAYDAVTGLVTFTPQGLVTPLITGLIAILGTVAAIWVIFWGVRFIKRVMGR
jgi:hypothetical protein